MKLGIFLTLHLCLSNVCPKHPQKKFQDNSGIFTLICLWEPPSSFCETRFWVYLTKITIYKLSFNRIMMKPGGIIFLT